MDVPGQGVSEDGRGSGEVMEAGMGGGNKGAREKEGLGGAEGTIWVIYADEVGDVAGGDVVDGLVCCV